ncbi:MAG: hypothetical protein FJX64_08605 [Alphaproteobacteria bacterium]|nr:hypothetical protein [Alphaproteobacteria bacterium]
MASVFFVGFGILVLGLAAVAVFQNVVIGHLQPHLARHRARVRILTEAALASRQAHGARRS